MKKWLAVCLCFLFLTGCTPSPEQYNATRFDLFDTVTTVTAVTASRETFDTQADAIYEKLLHYHRLFDIYNEYEGVNNLKTVNDAAGRQPVQVDSAIIELLSDCVRYYELTDGRMNIAMGSVLSLWHQTRKTAILPSEGVLKEAAKHTDITKLVIDRENSTVFIADPAMRLDVGAVAKGWAAQKVAETLPDGYLLSVGGNVCATGPKKNNTPWTVAIQHPDGGDNYLHRITLSVGSAVTSGDYQRFVEIGGIKYHHIIDPDTLFPGTLWRSVTVVCPDSALADALSTALFLLPLEDGKALLQKTGAEAIWLSADGTKYVSEGLAS